MRYRISLFFLLYRSGISPCRKRIRFVRIKSDPQPLLPCCAAYDIQSGTQLGSATPDASGGFSFDLPDGKAALIMALASKRLECRRYGMAGILPAVKTVTIKAGLSLTLLTEPAYQLVLEGGSPIGDETFAANTDDEFMPYLFCRR